jgi:hypothetical protein
MPRESLVLCAARVNVGRNIFPMMCVANEQTSRELGDEVLSTGK